MQWPGSPRAGPPYRSLGRHYGWYIEEMFSKVKGAMRSAAGRTKEAVYEAFGSALHDVTQENITGWFRDRAAYAMQL